MEGLLDKTLGDNEITKHIKGRSDFKELKLTENREYKGDGPDNVSYLFAFTHLAYFRATSTSITTIRNGFVRLLPCR